MFPHRTIAPFLVVVAAVREVASTCSIATCVLPSLFEGPNRWLFCSKPSDLAARLLEVPFHLQISDEFIICLPSGSSPSSTDQLPASLLRSPVTPWVYGNVVPRLHVLHQQASPPLRQCNPWAHNPSQGLNLQVPNRRRRAVFFILSKADCVPPSRCGFSRCHSQLAAGGAGYESGARLQGANGCFG